MGIKDTIRTHNSRILVPPKLGDIIRFNQKNGIWRIVGELEDGLMAIESLNKPIRTINAPIKSCYLLYRPFGSQAINDPAFMKGKYSRLIPSAKGWTRKSIKNEGTPAFE